MTRPPGKTRKTPLTKARPTPNRPKARTTPPNPAPTAQEVETFSLSPSGERVEAAQQRGERGSHGDARPIVLAVITGPHGITGEVRLKLFTEDLSAYRSFNAGALTLKSLRDANNGPIARFAEIPDRTAAERLRGTELTVPRSELPELDEGEYYHADLLGRWCETDTGEPLGHIAAVENFGAGDILEIEKPDGKRFMIPITAAKIGHRVVVDTAFVE